ncbi:MAG TPA: hypothetical protein VEJ23_05005, partial [Solirubrobacteraceae bacterium]|nr:hypothetical protein [Solirubrobacteraceae bacterium]
MPVVTFTAAVVPIAGFHASGYRLGAGAAVRVAYAIAGSEYNGYPAPLSELKLELPPGWLVRPGGFDACPPALLAGPRRDPRKCPTGSSAGTAGTISVALPAGGRAVVEAASVQPFYTSGGGIELN